MKEISLHGPVGSLFSCLVHASYLRCQLKILSGTWVSSWNSRIGSRLRMGIPLYFLNYFSWINATVNSQSEFEPECSSSKAKISYFFRLLKGQHPFYYSYIAA
ncbi:hypothetical protein Cni_G20963 [Canna indica]|uniref:Uncharacterized protein n=1 Tax=Canna indica TaxID=4628 RepID=A0AAQ3KNK8_9LILI|nr:hypothetical protein Cni_G20963 [Canna indica]